MSENLKKIELLKKTERYKTDTEYMKFVCDFEYDLKKAEQAQKDFLMFCDNPDKYIEFIANLPF